MTLVRPALGGDHIPLEWLGRYPRTQVRASTMGCLRLSDDPVDLTVFASLRPAVPG